MVFSRAKGRVARLCLKEGEGVNLSLECSGLLGLRIGIRIVVRLGVRLGVGLGVRLRL